MGKRENLCFLLKLLCIFCTFWLTLPLRNFIIRFGCWVAWVFPPLSEEKDNSSIRFRRGRIALRYILDIAKRTYYAPVLAMYRPCALPRRSYHPNTHLYPARSGGAVRFYFCFVCTRTFVVNGVSAPPSGVLKCPLPTDIQLLYVSRACPIL